jgi:endonuclease/exonuclease/phosphatase family metal-dependent hydrolase
MKIKIISLNIWHGGRLWDNALEFLKAEDPDILLLQEVFNDHNVAREPRFRTMDEFTRLFQFTDSDFAPTLLYVEEFGKVEQGNAILSKFPITNRYEPLFFNESYNDNYVDIYPNYETSPRNLQHIVVDVAGTELNLFNFQGVWDLDGEHDSEKRLRMSQVIVDAVKDKPNVILAGDTNATPNGQTIKNIEANLTNIFKDELATTFNLRRKDLVKFPGYASAVVDMAFVSPGMQVSNHSCPDVDVSDHLPLLFTIDVPGNNQ